MVQLEEILSKKALKSFVRFPFELYKKSPYWVPPIIKDEMEVFNQELNPVFEQAEARLFLARKHGKVVGRVAAIVNWHEVKKQGVPKMRFGWLDFIDDQEVSAALLDKVAEIGRNHSLQFVEGPVGFSNLDKVGVLTEGFDHIGTMITWYNHSYYADHLKSWGAKVEKEYLESKFPVSNADPALFVKMEALIRKRYGLTPLNFKNTAEIMPWVDQMFDLFNSTYARLSSFVAISDAQKAYFKKKYISLINPEYIKFIVDSQQRIIAFAIVMPSFSRALQKARGKLLPFGAYHLLKAKKHNKDAILYLIGIDPEYQNKGVTAIIFNEYYKVFKEKGVEMCYRTPELADNKAIQAMWKHFDPKVYKRRATFKKAL